MLIVSIISLVAAWKIFTKAGKPGWAAIIPLYNIYVMLQIIKKPGWWILLFLIPYVNIVMAVLLAIGLAKAFGKSVVFGIVFLMIIPVGQFIIAFGDSKYVYGASTPAEKKVEPAATTPSATPEVKA